MKTFKRIILIPILLICILMQYILLRFYTLNGKQYAKAYDDIMKVEANIEALRKEEGVKEIKAFGSYFTPTDIFIQTSDGKTVCASINIGTGVLVYRYLDSSTNEWVRYPESADIDVKEIIKNVAKNGGDSKEKSKVVYYGIEGGKKKFAYGIDNYASVGELLLNKGELKERSTISEFNKAMPEGYSSTTTREGLKDIDWKSPERIEPIEAKDEPTDEEWDEGSAPVSGFLDGLVGILLYPVKLGPALLGIIIYMVNCGITGTGVSEKVSPIENIIFYQNLGENKTTMFSTNFIDVNGGLTEGAAPHHTWSTIRDSIALWYYSLRNLSIIVLVVIAMYVGIRLAIETAASEQAKYKRHLINWIQSLCLVVVMHYIMILVNQVNDALVKLIAQIGKGTPTNGLPNLGNWIGMITPIPFVRTFAACIAFLAYGIVTLLFVVQYIKRMVTIAFLTVIAPLVTITYSIDKMRDGKAQAFDNWLREYCYTILIQPFHGVLFLVIGGTGLNLIKMTSGSQIGQALVGLYMLVFILQGENILRSIFGINPSQVGNAFTNIAMITALGKGAGKAGAKVVSSGKFAANSIKTRVAGLKSGSNSSTSSSSTAAATSGASGRSNAAGNNATGNNATGNNATGGSTTGGNTSGGNTSGGNTSRSSGGSIPTGGSTGKQKIKGPLTTKAGDNNKNKFWRSAGRGALKLGSLYARATLRATAIALGAGASIASGEPEKNLIPNLSNAGAFVSPINASIKERKARGNMKAWMGSVESEMLAKDPTTTTDQMRQHALDIYNGKVAPKTKYERILKNAMTKEAKLLRESGVADDKIEETLDKQLQVIQQKQGLIQNQGTTQQTTQQTQTAQPAAQQAAQGGQTAQQAQVNDKEFYEKTLTEVFDKQNQKIEDLVNDLKKSIKDGMKYKGNDAGMKDAFSKLEDGSGASDDDKKAALEYIGSHLSEVDIKDFEFEGKDKSKAGDARKLLDGTMSELKSRAAKYEELATTSGGMTDTRKAKTDFGAFMSDTRDYREFLESSRDAERAAAGVGGGTRGSEPSPSAGNPLNSGSDSMYDADTAPDINPAPGPSTSTDNTDNEEPQSPIE